MLSALCEYLNKNEIAINRLRIENLSRNLVKREISPLSPAHWRQFTSDLGRVGRQVATITDNWWTIIARRIDWLALILGGSVLLWWSLRRVRRSLLTHWFPMPATETPPPYLSRVSNAIGIFPIILAPGLLTAAVLYVYAPDAEPGQSADVYRLTRDWDEATVTWNVASPT